jgi:FkbM family methyltransferase
MLSFAQNAEDVLLWRVFSDVDPGTGFYIDIGANHPVIDSVTKHFYDQGWQGINVEPVAAHAERLAAERPRDVNLHAAVGADEDTLTLHHVVDNDGLSTFDTDLANGYRAQGMTVETVDVPVLTLRQIFDEHVDRPVQFLKIDVEGHEHEVIEGADWSRDRPYVLVIEATKPEKWEDTLTAASYVRVLDDGINYVFVADEHADLAEGLRRPVTVVDHYTPNEWCRRGNHYQRMLATYASRSVTDEMLAGAGRRASRDERAAARRLCEVLLRREDLIYTFVANGQVDHLALLGWALDLDPAIDPEIEALQSIRSSLESLRHRILARRR